MNTPRSLRPVIAAGGAAAGYDGLRALSDPLLLVRGLGLPLRRDLAVRDQPRVAFAVVRDVAVRAHLGRRSATVAAHVSNEHIHLRRLAHACMYQWPFD